MSTKVAIIESVGPNDLFEKRKEGIGLGSVLNLMHIEYVYYECFGEKHLVKAIREIQKKHRNVDYIHFSMHGSKEGISLMSGDFITWEKFDMLFWNKLKHIVLTFSSCEVGKGIHALFDYHRTFCKAIIAPTRTITWDEGLIAFSNLYFLAKKSNANIKNDLKKINTIIGAGALISVDDKNTILLQG